MFFLYLLIFIVGIILTLNIFKRYQKISKHQQIINKIPCPPSWFLIGHFYILFQKPENIFTTIRKLSTKYYPIYRFSGFFINVVTFLDPNDIEIVLSSTKHLSKTIIYSFLQNWLGTGLLTSNGVKWHKRRKILTPAFHFNILQQFLPVFNDETAKLVKNLNKDNGQVINIIPSITNFALQSIAETAMGMDNINEDKQRKYKEAINKIGGVFLRRLSFPWFHSKFIYSFSKLFQEENKLVKILHDFTKSIIKKREKEMNEIFPLDSYSKKKHLAMLDLLLSAKQQGFDIDYEGIREEVDTFMFEGHDTTSVTISYFLLVLANLQDIQAQVLNEILTVVGPVKPPTYDDLQELKFTERCIKELLRLFPAVPFFSRFASEDFTTKTGYKIPKGTILHFHVFDVHRNPNNFVDPLKFDPDRFLPENCKNRHPFAYFPFSAGPRNCIGQKFAILEIKSVICGILRQFKLEKVDDMYGVQFRPDITLKPLEDIKIKIITRQL